MDKPTNPEKEQDKQDAAEAKNFTRSPNMLIFGYRELSPQEKWLYVCLKHLCGKRGTRHLALRYISEQTGISVGALSTSKDKKGNVNEGMIRHLHNAGLIHSEIKKKDGKGNAQYHITITDVWDLNQAFFIERNKTRSEFGQDTGQDEDESSEPVRNSDEPVQNSDKSVRKPDKVVRNSDEPVRIPGQYQDYSKTTYKTDNKTTEQESTYPQPDRDDNNPGSSEPTHALSSSQDNSTLPAIKELSPVLDEAIERIDDARDALSQAGSDDYVKGHTDDNDTHSHSAQPAAGTRRDRAAGAVATATVQQPAGSVGRSGHKKAAEKQKYAVYFTLEGSQFRGWEETITGLKLDETAANARACNTLGTKSGMTYANLEAVHKAIATNKWVKERDVVVTVQDLASPDGVLRWEKWLPVALRNLQKQAGTQSANASTPTNNDDPYNPMALALAQGEKWRAENAERINL